VNIQGTNVFDCSSPDASSTCYINAFVPYTIEQQGAMEVRNHTGQTEKYSMPSARIEHGKALASEEVLTNPLSSSAN
jgi:hypothetical protein